MNNQNKLTGQTSVAMTEDRITKLENINRIQSIKTTARKQIKQNRASEICGATIKDLTSIITRIPGGEEHVKQTKKYLKKHWLKISINQ